MWKEIMFVGAAAALGEFAVQKWGNQIQAQAVKLHIPPMAAHIVIVGGSAAAGYAVLRAIF
jgi:hypothetical protein